MLLSHDCYYRLFEFGGLNFWLRLGDLLLDFGNRIIDGLLRLYFCFSSIMSILCLCLLLFKLCSILRCQSGKALSCFFLLLLESLEELFHVSIRRGSLILEHLFKGTSHLTFISFTFSQFFNLFLLFNEDLLQFFLTLCLLFTHLCHDCIERGRLLLLDLILTSFHLDHLLLHLLLDQLRSALCDTWILFHR